MQKRKPHPMTYYIMINKANGNYFINKSTRPKSSARHHFHRANNPERTDYMSDFYQDLRAYGEDGFALDYSIEPPAWMERRAHYMPATEASKAALQEILSRETQENCDPVYVPGQGRRFKKNNVEAATEGN